MDSFKGDELIYEFRKLLKNKKAVLLIVIGAVLLVGLVIFALLRSGIREEAPEETEIADTERSRVDGFSIDWSQAKDEDGFALPMDDNAEGGEEE